LVPSASPSVPIFHFVRMVQLSKFAVLAAGISSAAANWALDKSYVGPDFFAADKWAFFNEEDPTQGAVDYVTRERAMELGMVKATADKVYIGPGLQAVTPGSFIPSVRLESADTFSSALIVVTMDHQPAGCAVWPAFWMTGTDEMHPWPTWGEADFLEGAHGQNEVWTTLHTLQGCDQSALKEGTDFSGTWMSGLDPSVPSTNCSIIAPGQARNEGCPIVGPKGTMGPMFNAAGGGTFAWEWNTAGGFIRGFFWPAGQEPADIKSQTPNPDSWGLPYSKFLLSEKTCPTSLFQNMKIIINTDFCGQWGNLDVTFHEKCPSVPADMTCNQWVSNFPGNLTEAYWSINRLDVYQPSAQEEVVVV